MNDTNYQVTQTHPTSDRITILDHSNGDCRITIRIKTGAIKMSLLPRYLGITHQQVFSFCDIRRQYYRIGTDNAFEQYETRDSDKWLSVTGFDEFVQYLRRNYIAKDIMITKLVAINEFAQQHRLTIYTNSQPDNTSDSSANQMHSSIEIALRKEIDDLRQQLTELTKQFEEHIKQHETDSSVVSLPLVDNRTIICEYNITFVQYDSCKDGLMIIVNYEEAGITRPIGIDKPLLELKAHCSIEMVQSVLSDLAAKEYITCDDHDRFTVREANKDKAFNAFKYKLRKMLRKNNEDATSISN